MVPKRTCIPAPYAMCLINTWLFTSRTWTYGNLKSLHMTVNVQKQNIKSAGLYLTSFIVLYILFNINVLKNHNVESEGIYWSFHRIWKALNVSVRWSRNQNLLFHISIVTETGTRAWSHVRFWPRVYRPLLQRKGVHLLPGSILWTPLWRGLLKVPLRECMNEKKTLEGKGHYWNGILSSAYKSFHQRT